MLIPSPVEINALIALYNARRYAELESQARFLVSQCPDFGFGWKLLGGALQMQGKNALPAFQKTAQLLPGEADAHYNLGVALKSSGLLEDAAASYRRALKIKPDYAEAHGNLGNVLKELGRPKDAVDSYRRALALKPDSPETHNNLGNALKELGQPEEAVANYRQALARKPDYVDAHYNLGNVLKELGQLEDAVASYRKAIEMKPDFAEAHSNLCVVLTDLGQFNEAVTICRHVLEIKPDFAEAHSNLCVALTDLGQFSEAVSSCRRALEIKPDFAEAHNNLGNALRELGQLDEALASYYCALEIKPDYAEAHNSLSFALLLTGRFSEGWKEYGWRIRPQEMQNYPVRPSPEHQPFTRKPDKLLPSNLQGLRLTILGDQGLGDELFFLRFAKELKKRGAHLTYATDPRLVKIICRARWVDSVAEKGEVIEDSDAVLLVSDLPLVVGMATEADMPSPMPLDVLPEKRKEIDLRLKSHRSKGRPLIGITWRAGGDKRKKQMVREIPLEQLAVALREKQATFVVIQRNPLPHELAAFESALGQQVADFSDLNDDLEGMLALMEQLDDYIGVDNTNMHFRTSVGRAARMLVPHLQDFRCMATGDSSPWFPGFTLYRKDPNGNWDKALEQLKRHIHQTCIDQP
jgi:tetratricopeptide (TPR) repeat protein